MAKLNKVKEFLNKLLSENVEEDNEELIETDNNPIKVVYPDRVVFGQSLGEDFKYHTPAECFVGALYDFEDKMYFARNNDKKLEKINIDRQNFLNTYKKELKRKERGLNFLKEALAFSKSKEQFYIDYSKKYKPESKGFKILQDNYKRFQNVSNIITKLIEKELNQEPTK